MRYFVRRFSTDSVVALLLLGVAVGTSAALISIIDVVVLNPLRVSAPDRLVGLGGLAYGGGLSDPPKFWSQAQALDSLAIFRVGDSPAAVNGEERWARVAEVSSQFADVFRLALPAGRFFSHEEQVIGEPVVIVSDQFRRARFGRGAHVVGKSITVDGLQRTIIGVAPRAFDYPSGSQLWLPWSEDEARQASLSSGAPDLPRIRGTNGWVGRLRDGATEDQLREQLLALLKHANDVVSARTGVRYGDMVGISALLPALSRQVAPTLYTVLIAAGLMLLVAALNCGFVFFRRGSRLRQEYALRQALGATPRHITRDVLADLLVAASVAGISGAAFSVLLLSFCRTALHPFGIELTSRSSAWPLSVGVAVALAAVTSGAMLPALFRQARSAGLTELIHRRTSGYSAGGVVARRLITTMEVAIAVLLATGALFSTRVALQAAQIDLGYEAETLVVGSFYVPRDQLKGRPLREWMDRTAEAAKRIPGVQSAVLVSRFSVQGSERGFQHVSVGDNSTMAATTKVGSSYTEVLGIHVLDGRHLRSSDNHVVVMNTELSTRLFGPARAVGRSIAIGGVDHEIIGVVSPTSAIGERKLVPEILLGHDLQAPEPPGPAFSAVLLARCSGDCRGVPEALQQGLKSEASGLRFSSVQRASEIVAAVQQPARTRAFAWITFSGVGVGLALLGVITVVGMSATRRSKELAVRVALGAGPLECLTLLAGEGALCVAIGVLAGSAAAIAFAQVIASVIPGFPVGDFADLSKGAGAVLLAALVASVLPVVRLARKPPLTLLKA